jgi:hypothetical protein
MSELTDGPKFQETLVQIALTEIFRVLEQGELKPDSLNYIRLFNALARLNREALGLRKYNDHLAKEQAELKKLDIYRELAIDEHVAIVDRTDRIFEMPRPPGTKYVPEPKPIQEPTSEPSNSLGKSGSGREEAPSSPIENRKSKIKNPSSPLPSRPCSAETPQPARVTHPIKKRKTKNEKTDPRPPEHCLECGTALPPVPPDARRRPEDNCQNCGIRLPDIGLCDEPGFDRCRLCDATQPHLLPNGERPRPNCHKCGQLLLKPEPPAS